MVSEGNLKMKSAMQIFENNDFLAVDKRSGFLSVPSRLGEADSRPCEMRVWSKALGIRLWAVHRLDEEVSGILLFAKTSEAHRSANTWFEKKEIKKLYEALTEEVHGQEPGIKNLWKSTLLRGKKRAYERSFGKESVTEAILDKPEASCPSNRSQWKLSPLTGRSHQLRFEMSKHGYPICGDSLYGSSIQLNKPETIALRAVELDFSNCQDREKFSLPEKISVPGLLLWMKQEGLL